MTALFLTLPIVAAVAIWAGWRRASRRTVLPCPFELAWLVEMENPLARATRSEQIVAGLALRPGERAIDIGCGPGRVTIPMARAVGPDGAVIALDVQSGMLAKVAAKAAAGSLTNIQPLQTDVRHAQLQAGSLDAAAMVMALGEIPDAAGIFPAVFAMLKPGGRLAIAESIFDPHYVARRRLRHMASSAGFIERRCVGNVFGFCMTFERP
jgi:ubiquinone/menaquinone biosynthesis C-methylase UbiE